MGKPCASIPYMIGSWTLAAGALLLACALPAAPLVEADPVPAVHDETATVARVIDGDTFELTDHRRVRVLGIDSCEHGTRGGQAATAEARTLLPEDSQVTLQVEPGVNLDRYHRLLRYVALRTGEDYGTRMVTRSHTSVYGKHSDASPQRLVALRAADTDGRIC